MVDEIDKDPEGAPAEEAPPADQSKVEPEEESVTAADAMQLAQNLQKGYTMTRQDMAVMSEGQQKIQEALEKLQAKNDEFGGDEEEPLTVKKFLDLQKQQQQASIAKEAQLNQRIKNQLNDLRVQGTINTQEDEDELLKFAVKRKITNLSDAANRWNEIKDAKRAGVKEGLKGKVKVEAGSKIGTSQKSQSSEQGINYGEIASKSMDELAAE